MQPSRSGNTRQRRINAYRIGTSILLLAITVMTGALLLRPSTQALTVTQATKVEQASAYLQDVGFNDPVYQGIQPGAEGQYPTFQATAIGGQPVKLWIRTTPYGGLEIQPVGVFESVASADAFARLAAQSVDEWKHMPPGIKPRTDGNYGEYEERQYMYRLLAKYNPPASYWNTPRDETVGWPRR